MCTSHSSALGVEDGGAESLLGKFHVPIPKSYRLSARFPHELCRGEKTKVMMACKCRVLHTWLLTRGGARKTTGQKAFLLNIHIKC